MATTVVSSISVTCFFHVYLLPLLLLLVLNPFCSFNTVEGNEITKNVFHAQTVQISSLMSSGPCNQSSRDALHISVPRRPSTLEVVDRFGPCYQLNNDQAAETTPSIFELLRRDQSRVESLQAKRQMELGHNGFKDKMRTTISANSGTALGTGNYVVTVGLGTPKKSVSLVFDTGSDITWTQCEPCVGSCYKQNEPKLDPRKSSSYKNVSCSSTWCTSITASGGASGCYSSSCLYRVEYGDGSYSIGFLGTEKLTITSKDVFQNFVFGCGQNNRGIFGRSAGLMGLGRKKLSLPSQTANKYKKLFSYCIPSSSSTTGFLSLGGWRLQKHVKFTPLSPNFKDSLFYGLDITGINVGGVQLEIGATVFKTSGAIMDSGTVITRLPPKAYSLLSSTFQEQMKDYPKADPHTFLDTCFDFSNYNTILIPKISFFFRGGVEVSIDLSGILEFVNGFEEVCLAFAGNKKDDDVAILGNFQQKTYEVVYDGAEGRIGFAKNGCA